MDVAIPHRTFSGMAAMRIGINFAPRSRWPQPRDLGFLAGGLVVLAAASWSVYDAHAERLAARAEIKHWRASAVRTPTVLDPSMTAAVNLAIGQLNLPWDELFSAVEASAGEHISLLALEPEAARRILKVSGEAKNADEMIDFVSRLGRVGFFAKANLLHHEINEGDRNRPFRFVVDAEWVAK